MPPITKKEFAAKVKAKYPDYAGIDDSTLVEKMVTKYPEYKDQISDYSTPVAEKKKILRRLLQAMLAVVFPLQNHHHKAVIFMMQ